MSKLYKIGEVARFSGLSERCLRYYESIGLLVPQTRSASGYRLYADGDLLRLQRIMQAKQLGFSLDAIVSLMDAEPTQWILALEQQKAQLLQQLDATQKQLKCLDAWMLQMQEPTKGVSMMSGKEEQVAQMFAGLEPEKLEREAEARWGNTSTWRESKRRTATYTKEDWERYRCEQATWIEALAQCFRSNEPVDMPKVKALAEEHRESIGRWFYPCTADMQLGLAVMYEQDERFRAYYDRVEIGLTDYLVRAIRAQNLSDA